ncbi:MAG: hypothetical protein A2015_00425 [Spirochaetes bacterium GWF1_31_7]|nr:MAG: hypothetical protein A2Y30_04085 [Spirochaetes bacterium GWE1_32_154]OHD51050.1 MAG: hypothetical protein A2015_00425 [Spirochaetes bacterium GWF1_31_7]OHD51770.1 MAG: hypothetical protein A2Y29_09030 [Spirochaetes bacterium GWE2_31_10]
MINIFYTIEIAFIKKYMWISMKRFLTILIKTFEFHLLREHFSSSKKNFIYTTRFFLIFQFSIFFTSLLIAIFNKTILQTVLLSVFASILCNLFSLMLIKNAEKDKEETELKLKEYSKLVDEINRMITGSFFANVFLSFIITLLLVFIPFTTGLLGLKNSKLLFIIILFSSICIFISLLVYLSVRFFYKKNKKSSLRFDEIKKNKGLTISNRIFYNKILFNLKSYYETSIKSNKYTSFYQKNYLLINGLLAGFIISLIIAVKFKLSFTFIITFTQISGCLFSHKIFEKFNKYKRESQRPFIFAQFLFAIILFLSVFSFIRTTPQIAEKTLLFAIKDMIIPVTSLIDAILLFFYTIVHSKNVLTALLPVPLFTILYFSSLMVNNLIHIFEDYSDRKIKAELTAEPQALIFGDNLSLYPFTLRFIAAIISLGILYVELPFISNLIFSLINTLQVSEVFKIDIFTQSNIKFFFDSIFYISLIYIAYISLIDFIGAMFSHIMLFSGEVVFVKNLLITRNITRVPITRINHLVIKQNFIERFLDIGSLLIETSDRGLVMSVKGVTSITEKNRKIMDKVKVGLQKIK